MIVKLANMQALARPIGLGISQPMFNSAVPDNGMPNAAKMADQTRLNVMNHNKGPKFMPMASIGRI